MSVSPPAIVQGDVLEVLRDLPDNMAHCVVTDPPYGLSEHAPNEVADCLTSWLRGEAYVPKRKKSGFMGRAWDAWVPGPECWREVYRVLKPGGHALVFAGSRTSDLMGVALRLAGFEIRDSIQWWYGQGFPKSLDVSKAIDKAAGATREVVGTKSAGASSLERVRRVEQGYRENLTNCDTSNIPITAPATDAAKKWDGWGTALKPAHEPIIVARKPLEGTVAENVLAHGAGALNIDSCRISCVSKTPFPEGHYGDRGIYGSNGERTADPNPSGRWPANVVLTHTVDCTNIGTRRFRGSGSGARIGKTGQGYRPHALGAESRAVGTEMVCHVDPDGLETVEDWECSPGCPVRALDDQSGAASRFLYVSKASRRDRNTCVDGSYREAVANTHPTVKPLDLMRWLVRLVAPADGLVLDPFAGSGSTGVAAALEQRDFIGIEGDAEHCAIAQRRFLQTIDAGVA